MSHQKEKIKKKKNKNKSIIKNAIDADRCQESVKKNLIKYFNAIIRCTHLTTIDPYLRNFDLSIYLYNFYD